MDQHRIYEWIKHPERLNRDTLYELRTLLARYPYFQTVRLLYLKNLFLLHDVSFGEELRRAALYIPDRRILFQLIEGDAHQVKVLEEHRQKDETESLDRTLTLIDAFLASIPEEQSLTPSLQLDASADYTSYLQNSMAEVEEPEEETPVMLKAHELIDDFLEEQPVTPVVRKNTEEPSVIKEMPPDDDEFMDDESYFTETLAKIYVKQRRYSKALEIIKKLYLKYPKKNIYFADQIRFLEKLIINTKSK